MAARRARNSKGQFTKRRSATKRRTPARSRRSAPARRRSTRKGMVRKTARRAYEPSRRRRARRNAPKWDKALMSIGLWAAGATIAQQMIAGAVAPTLSPEMQKWAPWASIAGLGAVGAWLLKKASTRNAGYAVMGIAVAQAAAVGWRQVQTMMDKNGNGSTETPGGFLPASAVVRPSMTSAVVPQYNPVAGIVVPG